jgi:multidrug efflux pump
MNISSTFIRRPVATTLLTLGLVLAGFIAFRLLPVSPLPQVDFPTISVSASLPGADPETMSTSVAAPLERQFGRIAGVAGIGISMAQHGMSKRPSTPPEAICRQISQASRPIARLILRMLQS